MYFKTTQLLVWKMLNKITNAICQLTNSVLPYVSAVFWKFIMDYNVREIPTTLKNHYAL